MQCETKGCRRKARFYVQTGKPNSEALCKECTEAAEEVVAPENYKVMGGVND